MKNHHLDPLNGYMKEVIENNDKDKIELQAQEVTSKEEQLITRKRTGKMFLDDIVRQVKQGNMPATFAVLQLKQFGKMFKDTLDKIEDQSECEEILIMEKHLKELKGKYKAAFQGVEKGITQVVEGHKFVDVNGEILSLPKIKYNKSSIVLTKV